MWNRKANRIADLEARLKVALRERQPAADTAIDNALRSDLATARATLRAKDARLGLLQQQVDQLIARLGEYADAGIANGQRADRYRKAWISARRTYTRYRAELADQKQVIDRQGVQLLDAFDYAPGDRARLGLPAQEVTT